MDAINDLGASNLHFLHLEHLFKWLISHMLLLLPTWYLNFLAKKTSQYLGLSLIDSDQVPGKAIVLFF